MKLILIVVSLVSLAFPVKNITLTNAERKFAIRYLSETQKDLGKAVRGLTETQLTHRNEEQGWTIAECLQHLAVVESGVLGMVKSSEHCVKEPVQKEKSRYSNRGLINAVIRRPEKLSTPDMLLAGKYSKCDEAVSAFNADREEIKKWIEVTQADLHALILPHPNFGMLDTYQWVLLLAAHSHQHIMQIEDVQKHSKFPKK
jgi:hypothetical protein